MFTMVVRYVHHTISSFPWPGKNQVFPTLSAQFSVFLTLQDFLHLLQVTGATCSGEYFSNSLWWHSDWRLLTKCRRTDKKLATLGVHMTWEKGLKVAIWWTLHRSMELILSCNRCTPFPHALCAAAQWTGPGNELGWKNYKQNSHWTAVLPNGFDTYRSLAINSRYALL